MPTLFSNRSGVQYHPLRKDGVSTVQKAQMKNNLVSTDNLVMIYSPTTQNKRYCAGVPPIDDLLLQSLKARCVMHLQYHAGHGFIYPGEGHLPNLT